MYILIPLNIIMVLLLTTSLLVCFYKKGSGFTGNALTYKLNNSTEAKSIERIYVIESIFHVLSEFVILLFKLYIYYMMAGSILKTIGLVIILSIIDECIKRLINKKLKGIPVLADALVVIYLFKCMNWVALILYIILVILKSIVAFLLVLIVEKLAERNSNNYAER